MGFEIGKGSMLDRFLSSSFSSRGRMWLVLRGAASTSEQVENPLPSALHEGLGNGSPIAKYLARRAAVMDSNGWRSSVLPPVILKVMIWPWWLMGRWSLKPKNQPMAVPFCSSRFLGLEQGGVPIDVSIISLVP